MENDKKREGFMSNMFGFNKGNKNDTCCCNIELEDDPEETSQNRLVIEWKHLDSSGETCDRCYDTGENLNAEIKRLQRKLDPKGIKIEYIETKLDGSKVKESNEILFNGLKIEDIIDIEVAENFCASCSDMLGSETFCRTIIFEGEEYEDIPAKAIRQAAMKVLKLDEGTEKQSTATGCGCGGGGSCC